MPYVILNSNGHSEAGTNTGPYRGVIPATAGNSNSSTGSFITAAKNWALPMGNPQIILAGQGTAAGACLAAISWSPPSTYDYTVGFSSFTWCQTYNTSTGAISPALVVVSATSTVLTVNSSPATAGFSTTGIIQVFHNSTPDTIACYSYTGLSGSTFTGCTLLSLTFPAINADLVTNQPAVSGVGPYCTTSSIALTSLSAGDKVVQYWTPPSNATITQAFFAIQIGNTIGGSSDLGSSTNPSDWAIQGIYPVPNPAAVYGSTTPYSFNGQTTPVYNTLVSLSSPPVLGSGTPGNYFTFGATPQAVTGWIYQSASVNVTPLTSLQYGAWVGVTWQWGSINQSSDVRLGSVVLQLTYALPPSSTLTMPNYVGGIVYTKSPTISWVYNSPQGTPQSTYRVVVFNTTDTALTSFNINDPSDYAPVISGTMGGGQTWGLATGLPTPVYDSGDVISSTATSAAIPPGILISGNQYRVFVFVTDGVGGSSGSPYQIMTNSGTVTGNSGALNAGMDFTIGTEPVLMPALSFPSTPSSASASFNPATGEIGPMTVRARQNLLSAVDADFGVSSPAGLSVGGWHIATGTGYSTGTGTSPTVTAAASTSYAAGALSISTYGTTTTQVAISSGFCVCASGEIITATAKVFNTVAAHATTAYAVLSFYNPTLASLIGHQVAPVYNPQPVPTSSTTAQSNPGLIIVQSRAPLGDVVALPALLEVNLTIIFVSTISGAVAGLWEVFQPTISSNVINVLDDSTFAARTLGATNAGSLPLQAPINVGWQSEPKGTNAAGTVVTDTGISYLGGSTAVDLPLTDATHTSSVHTAALILSFCNDTSTWLMAADLRVAPASAALSPAMGIVTSAGAIQASANTVESTTAVWQRFSGSFAPNLAGGFGYYGVVIPATAVGELRATNLQLERVWTFQDGGFERFGVTTIPFPQQCALGDNGYSTGTPGNFTQFGHWWTICTPMPTGYGAETASASPFTGVASAVLISPANGSVQIGIDQYFTVSGWTSITATWEWGLVASNAQGYIEFFDSANTLLSAMTTPGTVSSQAGLVTQTGSSGYTAKSTTVSVPTNAAYAHIVFMHQASTTGVGELFIDAVTVTGTGTLRPSTPWLDGGWSQGGLSNVGTTTVTLERSGFNVEAGWSFLRQGTGLAGPVIVAPPGLQGIFEDFEFPAIATGTTETLYYRAAVQSNGGSPSPYNIIPITNTNGFATSNWTLTDVLQANGVVLQVVGKVDFTTAENQTVLMPMGRGRKVVLGDSLIFGDTITVPLQTLTNADFIALKALYSLTYPLVLRSPDGEWWYVRGTTRTRTRTWQGSYARPLRTYSLVFEEVDIIP